MIAVTRMSVEFGTNKRGNYGAGNSLKESNRGIIQNRIRNVIMTKKTPIKIIKREERNRQEKPEERSKTTRESAQDTARDMVATVSNWVSEFQQKRRVETSQAIKTLFPETPRTSEA
jgi:hypothetical protein